MKMKRILVALFALSLFSTAQSETFVDISYASWSGLPAGLDADGYGIEYSRVNENIMLSAGYATLDMSDDYYGYEISQDSAIFSGAFGADSFATGTLYIGAGFALVDGESDASLSVGYSKYNINEFSYNLSVTTTDGELSFGADMRLPVGKKGGGILVGYLDTDIGSITSIGYSFGF